MNKLSIRMKISLLAIFPLICYLVITSMNLNESYKEYMNSETSYINLKLSIAASNLAHESQKERGKTAGFLSGGIDFANLDSQRKESDKVLKKFAEGIDESWFSDEYKKELKDVVASYKPLRDKVYNQNISTGEAISTYTKIIKRLLHMHEDIANASTDGDVATRLHTLSMIEEAKENGGKLRANMTAILAKNKPISTKKFNQILKLKSGITSLLYAPSVKINEESLGTREAFLKSKEWKRVNSVFTLIIKNSNKGRYNQDSKAFFATISGALSHIGALVKQQKNYTKSKIYVQEAKAKSALIWNTAIAIFLTVSLLTLVIFFSRSVSNSITAVTDTLTKRAESLGSAAQNISNSSVELSEATTEQASSVQETVSSVNEIDSMVQRNAESAGKAQEVSNSSKKVVHNGKRTVEEMISSMNNISNGNQDISRQMAQSNEQLTEIVKVISEIGEKTKVINDIVFQTKLLSFNASVEAARAGEHGKGFAVVAEEVGNLAQMSGNAAEEISSMLDESISKVNRIVEDTKSKVDNLVESGKSRVAEGIDKAKECDRALDEILTSVGSVNEMVELIASSSVEQSTGIKEINKAMHEMDSVTQTNSGIAQNSANYSTELKEQATELNNVISELKKIVEGSADGVSKPSTKISKTPSTKNSNERREVVRRDQDKNVFSLQEHKNNVATAQKPAPVNSSAGEIKKAVGQDFEVPSDDHPDFKDV